MPSKKKITIDAHKVAERDMYLHQHIGDGSYGDIKFNLSSVIPDGSILVTIGEGIKDRYIVHSSDIVKALLHLHESKK